MDIFSAFVKLIGSQCHISASPEKMVECFQVLLNYSQMG